MVFRAFISTDIVPGEALVSALGELSKSGADLKIVKPQLLHVTLKFLGDTEETIIEDLHARMRDASAGIRPFTIKLQGMGAFPSLSNVRVVWVGMQDGQLLGEIAKKLDESLKDLGFDRDKKGFVPHLTVARARSGRNIANVQGILRNNITTDYGEYSVDRILLKKSVLSPQGPSYSTVREHLLTEG
jgi:RNA 2',3'-cyclic 3'-phosphodiesterase